MIALAHVLAGLSLIMSAFLLVQLRAISLLMFVKLLANAWSPLWAILGAVGASLGWMYRAPGAIPAGVVGAAMMTWYAWRCTRDHEGFEKAFGAGWEKRIPPEQARLMVRRRWTWFLSMKASPEPRLERDLSYWTLPDTQEELLCDVWSPASGRASGLAIVYLHSSGWAAGDKDFGTRPFFGHLVAQGHTVMDVAYRLCPEVDIFGMVGDVKRAVAWMKANASRYGVDPSKLVLAGGSAGAHLALLAGNAPQHPELTPGDLRSADLSVCGIVSYYGPTDLRAGYEPWRAANPNPDVPPPPSGARVAPGKRMAYAGRMDLLLGGRPDDVPDMYRLASPSTHIHPGSPPTLLLQGDRDVLVPVNTTRTFHEELLEAGVPSVIVVFPWTEHAFDVAFPQVSPPAQSALYDVDRFLALLLNLD